MKQSLAQQNYSENAILCDQLTASLKSTCHWFSRVMNTKYRKNGITSQQYHVLVLLRERSPEAVTLKFLKENIIEKSSDVSRIVDKLFQKQLVERKECSEDRRRADIKITAKGVELVDKIGAFNKAQRLSLNLNPNEAQLLRELLGKLTLTK